MCSVIWSSSVTLCQVNYVNEISDASSVNGCIILTEDAKVGQVTIGHSHYVRHQIVWNVIGTLTNFAARMSSNLVKVPQSDGFESRISLCHILHDLLDHSLGLTIRVDRLDLVFLFTSRIVTINACARTEHKCLDIILLNELEKRNGSSHIIVVVHQWMFHGLANSL